MINGYDILKEKYPDFDEDSRTPNGLDLRLGKVFKLAEDLDTYGIYDDQKNIPRHIEIKEKPLWTGIKDLEGKVGWILEPGCSYILEVDREIKISENSMQLYRPRSSLLRSAISLHTAVGDAGYNGKLAFLCVNNSNKPFRMEKGVRFAQMIDFEIQGSSIQYDGDYQNDKHKMEK